MQFHMMTLLDVLGKIFYHMVKSQISLSGVQEYNLYPRLSVVQEKTFFYFLFNKFMISFRKKYLHSDFMLYHMTSRQGVIKNDSLYQNRYINLS